MYKCINSETPTASKGIGSIGRARLCISKRILPQYIKGGEVNLIEDLERHTYNGPDFVQRWFCTWYFCHGFQCKQINKNRSNKLSKDLLMLCKQLQNWIHIFTSINWICGMTTVPCNNNLHIQILNSIFLIKSWCVKNGDQSSRNPISWPTDAAPPIRRASNQLRKKKHKKKVFSVCTQSNLVTTRSSN